MDYEKLFQRTLLKEEDRAPVNMSPPFGEPELSDEEHWGNNNPDIVDNEELSSRFDTEGLDKKEIEKYSGVIAQWNDGLSGAIDQLAQMIKFAASEKLAEAPGSEQFSELIKLSPTLKRDLSGFKSQVEDLAETVKLAISDAQKEKRNNISALGQ
jgi:hypothetical protein